MGLNGNNRCKQPGCPFGAPEYLTRDLCEEHFEKQLMHPLLKEISRLQGEVSKLRDEQRRAKLEYGVKPPVVWIHCTNHTKGCTFKALPFIKKNRNETSPLEIHESLNCKFRKGAVKKDASPRKPGQPKQAKAPLSPQMMSDE